MACLCTLITCTPCGAKQAFNLATDIQMTTFPRERPFLFSPNRSYVAVWTEQGRLDVNQVCHRLNFYRSRDIKAFLEHSDGSSPPSPMWVVRWLDRISAYDAGWLWLSDSSGVAFVKRTPQGNQQLVLANLRDRSVQPLSSATQSVEAFDVLDTKHYVYVGSDLDAHWKMIREVRAEQREPAVVVGRHSLGDLTCPERSVGERSLFAPRYLWAVVDGKSYEVRDHGERISPRWALGLALSPDGRSVVTAVPVSTVPQSWGKLYPPPSAATAYRIRADQSGDVLTYVRIDLQTGLIRSLTGAPYSWAAGWVNLGHPSWSRDGLAILLPGTFIRTKADGPSEPCVAVVDLPSGTATCVEYLQKPIETTGNRTSRLVTDVHFVDGDRRSVAVVSKRRFDESTASTEYHVIADGVWHAVPRGFGAGDAAARDEDLDIAVTQALDAPPALSATAKGVSRVIWNPNPQLSDVELGHASLYTWKDKQGRDWRGGLLEPPDYKHGVRYPLVIQTHGFTASEFLSSGAYTTAFAARALAASGIVVLQVDEHCTTVDLDEGPCAVAGYVAAVEHLTSEGVIDASKVGIIGFSRTCFYVMTALASGSSQFQAASITDGVMEDYLQYVTNVGRESAFTNEANSMIGAAPFGVGLKEWFKRSPGFNLERVTASLLVVALGPDDVLFMWEPYALLRYLRKPVDMVMLTDEEHVLTNPAARMASQGGSVDWFRFWLQGYEDRDSGKAEQYRRWETLCDMKVAQNPEQPAFCVRSRTH
jgi:hypothetical protein